MRDSGSEVIGIPSARRTSADPDAEEEALAPCYHMEDIDKIQLFVIC